MSDLHSRRDTQSRVILDNLPDLNVSESDGRIAMPCTARPL